MIILKTQPRFKSERHMMPSNVQICSTSLNDDKRTPPIDSVETEWVTILYARMKKINVLV